MSRGEVPRGRVRPAGARRVLRLGGGLAPALLLAACAVTQPFQAFDSVGHLKNRYAERVGAERAARVAVPFELSDEIRAAAAERVSPAGGERARVDRVLEFIFAWLDLKYALTPTRNAVETYEVREGNCLSFVNLFVGLAREQRLNPFFVEVKDYNRWNYRQGMVVSHGHIVAGMYIDGELSTFDFLPYRPKSYRDFEPIDDLKAAAHYYNNLGAEALMAGDLGRAYELLETAVALAPGFDKAVNNLGVALLRLGRAAEALELYDDALAEDPENVALVTNSARAYQELGRREEAMGLLSQLEDLQHTNPFFFVYRGELALAEGDPRGALDYMAKALRRDDQEPEVHLGLVKVYLALGDLRRARHHLERALRLDATHQEARKYAAMLEGREAGGDGKSDRPDRPD